jgi:tetratricopeptide (TPR) repeat protein
LLRAQGDYAGAEPLFRRALAITEKALGPEHPSTGKALNNLALLLWTKGDYAGAEPLFRRALAITEKALGPEHPDTGIRLNNLAGLLRAQGDYAAAEPLLRRALAIVAKRNGATSTQLARLTNKLGSMLRDAGLFENARTEFENALRIWEALGHQTEKASTLNALGELCELEANRDDALGFYRACLEIRERLLPPDDPGLPLLRIKIDQLQKST